jgi:anaphase-promoting complex subunit 2
MWETFDRLGLLDRYENIIASVGYDHIEKHVLATCTGKWAEPVLESLRDWMSKVMVPWMVLMYARNAQTGESVVHHLL